MKRILQKSFKSTDLIFHIEKTTSNYSVFKLFMDISKLDLGSGEIIILLLVPEITFIVFGFIGGLVFQKKEIK
ncbi:hypothetical protein PC41400_16885 [Paenibacillus chitinolyticus]|uniref:Uncharacterized protein n=1 Tax=Paenibacillus chitinolyticus TaxID=79263 RepID=A0A410WYI3_9BACL|nr:hypothetical protein PC41400_16885 [Paenibacillus chitinolyticus]